MELERSQKQASVLLKLLQQFVPLLGRIALVIVVRKWFRKLQQDGRKYTPIVCGGKVLKIEIETRYLAEAIAPVTGAAALLPGAVQTQKATL